MRDLIQPNYTCLASTTAGPARSPSMSRSSADDANLKIGAVARLTGLSVHTLRKWEDRYGAVEPRRNGARRPTVRDTGGRVLRLPPVRVTEERNRRFDTVRRRSSSIPLGQKLFRHRRHRGRSILRP